MSTFNELIDFTRSTTGTYLDSVVYGEELVTNGTFDNNLTGWTTGSNVTSVYYSGAAQLTLGGALTSTGANWFSQSVFETGKRYFVTFDATYVSGGSLQAGYGFDLEVTASSSGTYSFIVNPDIGAGSLVHRKRVTFAGASGAVWRIDNVSVKEITGGQVSGTPLLRTAAINEPRLEYDASGNPLGLLIEEARTNLFRYSQELSNVDHSLITTDNATVSPDGTQNASLCVPTNVTTEHYLDDQNVISGTDYAISCFAKYGSGSFLLAFRGGGVGGNPPEFNLQTGTVVNEGAPNNWSNTKIEDVGNGWYRCSSVGNPNATTPLRVQIVSSDGQSSFLGDGTGHYIWGVQIEQNSFPTSYIPTSGSAVTRFKDIASLPVERFAYNQPQGSIVCQFTYFFEQGGSKRTYEFSDGTDDNLIRIFDHNNVNKLQANVKSGGAGVVSLLINAPTMLSGVKIFQTYKLNNYSAGAGGTLAGTDLSGALPVGINKLNIGSARNSGAVMSGHITSLQYYPKKLSNTELQLLTQPSASPTMNLTFDGQATSTLVEGFHD